ncbi:MAG: prepilin-type N-terminal cleavage/methylation domain-containing protein [Phycisphaerales bacterium]|nr:prepilin-type N-terminal cleavage/methylation domain-containing protein [Phycisphaerales bacterium]
MATRAFTLIELVAVIMITAILAGVAIPAVWGVADARSTGAARAIAQQLSFARERALNTGNRVWVVFHTGTDRYELLAEPDGGAGYADAVALPDPTTGRGMGLTLNQGEFAGVGIASAAFDGSAVVGFDWLGSPLDASGGALSADGVVTLDSGVTIGVAAMTGDIRIGP